MVSIDELTVEKQSVGNIGWVKADGVVDISTMRPIREAVRDLVSQGARHIVLDFSRVNYIDSAGMSLIMGARRCVSDLRGEVYLVAEPRLNLHQFDSVVHFASSLEEAMDALSGAVPA